MMFFKDVVKRDPALALWVSTFTETATHKDKKPEGKSKLHGDQACLTFIPVHI